MPATVTVTGKAGPAQTLTSIVFYNITYFSIETINNILLMLESNGRINRVTIDAATTITATKSGNIYTLTIS